MRTALIALATVWLWWVSSDAASTMNACQQTHSADTCHWSLER